MYLTLESINLVELSMVLSANLRESSDQLKGFIDRLVPKKRLTGALPDISTDYVRLQDEVMWGGIWQVPGLDITLRSIATISAQCCNGWGFGLQHQIRVGLSLGMSPQKVKGIFFQLMFYAGIPATVFVLTQAQKVINEREVWINEDLVPLQAKWMATVEEKMARGRNAMPQLWGLELQNCGNDALSQALIPEIDELVSSYNYGEVWDRCDLSSKERTVCIMVALMCRGHFSQLRRHLICALDMSFTKRELCEVFSQAAWYRGWPYLEEALGAVEDVFAEDTIQ